VSEFVEFGGVISLVACAGFLVRHVTVLIITVWSLRANPSGRRHAVELVRILAGRRHDRQLTTSPRRRGGQADEDGRRSQP